MQRKKINVCYDCKPLKSNRSIDEIELFNWINNLIPCIPNYKIPHSNGKELDIYIPTLSLGIEFNGIYWHSTAYKDKNFHVDKLDYCKKNNIKLIYVWEDVLPIAVWAYQLYDLGEAGQPLEFIRLLGKCASHCSESIYVWEDVLPTAVGI